MDDRDVAIESIERKWRSFEDLHPIPRDNGTDRLAGDAGTLVRSKLQLLKWWLRRELHPQLVDFKSTRVYAALAAAQIPRFAICYWVTQPAWMLKWYAR